MGMQMLSFGFVAQKCTSLHGTFDVFCVNVRGGVLAVGWIKNPKNSRVNISVREVAHARKRNPLSDLDKNFAGWQVSPT